MAISCFAKRVTQSDFKSAKCRGGLCIYLLYGEQFQCFVKCCMVKMTSQFREKRTGISKAAPIESWERGYFSNTCDSLVGGHLYNDPFASVHNAVSGMKLV